MPLLSVSCLCEWTCLLDVWLCSVWCSSQGWLRLSGTVASLSSRRSMNSCLSSDSTRSLDSVLSQVTKQPHKLLLLLLHVAGVNIMEAYFCHGIKNFWSHNSDFFTSYFFFIIALLRNSHLHLTILTFLLSLHLAVLTLKKFCLCLTILFSLLFLSWNKTIVWCRLFVTHLTFFFFRIASLVYI